jgi:hypothetical protein
MVFNHGLCVCVCVCVCVYGDRTFGATHRDPAHITCTRRWNFSNGVPTFALGILKVITTNY